MSPLKAYTHDPIGLESLHTNARAGDPATTGFASDPFSIVTDDLDASGDALDDEAVATFGEIEQTGGFLVEAENPRSNSSALSGRRRSVARRRRRQIGWATPRDARAERARP